MDLEVKDVAQLLSVSEVTILKWLSEGKIPSYQINGQYRFNRSEMESWMIDASRSKEGLGIISVSDKAKSLKEIDETAIAEGSLKFDLYRAIHRGGIFDDIAGKDKEAIIQNTTKRIAEKFELDSEVLTSLLLDRENMMSTGINQGVAIPHTRDFLLNTHYDAVIVVYPETPIDYDALDKAPVHTLFFLFACSDKSHLHLLAKIASFCQNKENLEFLKEKPNSLKLLQKVKDWEKEL